MSRIKLVLSDMDGTLLPFGKDRVSERTIAAITQLRSAGIEFGPSSGRELSDLIKFFHNDARCVETGIMGNGKTVYLDGKLVYRRPLPADQMHALVNVARETHGAMLNFYLPLDEYGRGTTGFGAIGLSEDEKELFPMADLSHDVFAELPEGEITTCAVIINPDVCNASDVHSSIIKACPGLDFPQPAPNVFDVVEKGWSKVSALPILIEHLGIGVEEIAYLGDSQNDLTMMEAIPHSFCMGNGSKEAKAAARWVVDTCQNDGAAQVMEMLAATRQGPMELSPMAMVSLLSTPKAPQDAKAPRPWSPHVD